MKEELCVKRWNAKWAIQTIFFFISLEWYKNINYFLYSNGQVNVKFFSLSTYFKEPKKWGLSVLKSPCRKEVEANDDFRKRKCHLCKILPTQIFQTFISTKMALLWATVSESRSSTFLRVWELHLSLICLLNLTHSF